MEGTEDTSPFWQVVSAVGLCGSMHHVASQMGSCLKFWCVWLQVTVMGRVMSNGGSKIVMSATLGAQAAMFIVVFESVLFTKSLTSPLQILL